MTDRALLAAVLTPTRAPLPIPTDVLDRLETLLAAEREIRDVVEAAALPSLADEGVALPGFPAGRVALWRGDLTRLRADAIVNAANNRMLGCFVPGHACIDNAIHAAAGPRLRDECAGHMREQGFPEPTGRAVITSGYQLPSSHVIHTVGPIARTEITLDHKEQLANSYSAVLDAAETRGGISTVGLCSVSTGVIGFPKELAATICLDSIADWFAAHPGSLPTNAGGINRAINWVARRTGADADTLWAIEGAATYGAILAGTVASHGYPVAEAPRLDAKKRRGVGKTDALDAHQIAAATLLLPVEKLRRPRLNNGIRQAVRILTTARGSMSGDRTRSVNALNALANSNNLGLDTHRSLTASQISEVSR